MAETIDKARQIIEARLSELDGERQKLKKALDSLQGEAPIRRAHSRSKPRKRAKRGQRRQQFLDQLKRSPGSKAAEVGAAIGVSANQAYVLARQLTEDGSINKQGSRYALAEAAGPSAGATKRGRRKGKASAKGNRGSAASSRRRSK